MQGTLKARLATGEMLVAPGVYDMISLRMAVSAGASVAYMTGYGSVASHLGLPDAGLASYRDMVGRVEVMGAYCRERGIPLIADGDTGYGGIVNVAHTVRGYEAAGASAIQIEDQVFPKKCGHTLGRAVIPTEDMVTKIKVATDARRSDEFLILARTDARTTHGLDEAIHRMEQYDAAGADILFIESPESEAELARIAAHFSKPVLVNNVEGGRTPVLPQARLRELGFGLSIYPATGFLAVGAALENVYAGLLNGGEEAITTPLYNFEKFNKLMGFEEIYALEDRFKA
ncbi:isocitrate lyase/PEP mutase family protein [Salipiger pacificus]|nr:isocitrate lyase/PEP mutase family protein [Alloyangia pacifica]